MGVAILVVVVEWVSGDCGGDSGDEGGMVLVRLLFVVLKGEF